MEDVEPRAGAGNVGFLMLVSCSAAPVPPDLDEWLNKNSGPAEGSSSAHNTSPPQPKLPLPEGFLDNLKIADRQQHQFGLPEREVNTCDKKTSLLSLDRHWS